MSDFGVIIKFKRSSGSLQSSDLEAIKSALGEIITEQEYPDNIVESNFLDLREWDEGEYVSIISEYYLDEEEMRAFAEDEDLEQAKDIVLKLKTKLGSNFEISSHLEDW